MVQTLNASALNLSDIWAFDWERPVITWATLAKGAKEQAKGFLNSNLAETLTTSPLKWAAKTAKRLTMSKENFTISERAIAHKNLEKLVPEDQRAFLLTPDRLEACKTAFSATEKTDGNTEENRIANETINKNRGIAEKSLLNHQNLIKNIEANLASTTARKRAKQMVGLIIKAPLALGAIATAGAAAADATFGTDTLSIVRETFSSGIEAVMPESIFDAAFDTLDKAFDNPEVLSKADYAALDASLNTDDPTLFGELTTKLAHNATIKKIITPTMAAAAITADLVAAHRGNNIAKHITQTGSNEPVFTKVNSK
ncbi:MAG: hypothetical protein ACTSXQ_00210 [Alphaproteobacteria bacterium]